MSRAVRSALTMGLVAVAMGGCAPTAENMSPYVAQPGTGGLPVTGSGGVVASGGAVVQSGGIETGGTGGMITAPAATSDLPCDVQEVVAEGCWNCHGLPTNFGAPMSLTKAADFEELGKGFQNDSKITPVHQLVSDRVNRRSGQTGVMPPTGQLAADDLSVLNAWLAAGRPVGTGESCGVVQPSTGGMEGNGNTDWVGLDTAWPGGVKPEETCYQFLKHGGQTPGDTSPHMTENGETYVNFYYKVPWTEPMIATRWRTIYDNTQVLHHWLLYKASPAVTGLDDGKWNNALGTHPGAQLVAGWAVGGGDEDFPEGVGLRMPAPGAMFELEWHLYNTTGAQVADRSGIEVCVVPESTANPKFVAGLTWLGTEDLVIPPGAESKRGGICTPSFKNGGPIHIVKWLPHMHLLGTQMDTWVLRGDGSEELVFSKPFQFDRQISYNQNPPVIINEGDRLHAQCSFRNPLSRQVVFGQSTNDEMCYQFAIAYPAGSLDSGSASWTGSDNTCLTLNIVKP